MFQNIQVNKAPVDFDDVIRVSDSGVVNTTAVLSQTASQCIHCHSLAVLLQRAVLVVSPSESHFPIASMPFCLVQFNCICKFLYLTIRPVFGSFFSLSLFLPHSLLFPLFPYLSMCSVWTAVDFLVFFLLATHALKREKIRFFVYVFIICLLQFYFYLLFFFN